MRLLAFVISGLLLGASIGLAFVLGGGAEPPSAQAAAGARAMCSNDSATLYGMLEPSQAAEIAPEDIAAWLAPRSVGCVGIRYIGATHGHRGVASYVYALVQLDGAEAWWVFTFNADKQLVGVK